METYTRQLVLAAERREAFAWHARPGAFARLAPPWQRLRLEGPPPPLEDGTRLAFRVGPGPFSLRWVAEHRRVEPPARFEDVQIAGPFRHWHHRHLFARDGAGSRLVDRVDWALPAGAIAHRLAGAYARRELDRLFAYRHRVLAGDLRLHARFRGRARLTVAISGAGGTVGSVLAALLGTGGHRVLRLVRTPVDPGDDEVRWRPERGIEPADLDRLEGIDAVVHLAGEPLDGLRWTARKRRAIEESRILGTRSLVASLGRLARPPAVFACASAVGWFGDRGDERLDESSAAGEGFLAELCRQWEAEAAGAGEWGARTVSLRFGVVLTPAAGALAAMLPAFRLGLGGSLGGGRQFVPWVSIDDAAGAVVHTLFDRELAGPLVVAAPRPVRQRELARSLGRTLSRPAAVPVPGWALRALCGEMADEALLASCRAEPARLAASGYSFRHPELQPALEHLLGRDLEGPRPSPEEVAVAGSVR